MGLCTSKSKAQQSSLTEANVATLELHAVPRNNKAYYQTVAPTSSGASDSAGPSASDSFSKSRDESGPYKRQDTFRKGQRHETIVSASIPEHPEDTLDTDLPPVWLKANHVRERLMSAMQRSPLFQQLSEVELQKLVDVLRETQVAAGTVVMQEGERCEDFLLIDSGEFEMETRCDDGQTVRLCCEGESFGFLAESMDTAHSESGHS